MDQPATPGGQCPVCAAPYVVGVTTCAVCGSLLVSAREGAADLPPLGGSADASLMAARAPEAAESQADDHQKRCAWCGALDAETAEVGQGCGAAFPRPEQDEALLRASQERIRVANDSISTLRKERERKGLGRLFGR